MIVLHFLIFEEVVLVCWKSFSGAIRSRPFIEDIWTAFYVIEKNQRMSKNIELIILYVEPHRVIIKKLLGCMPETHNNSNIKYSWISIRDNTELCQNLRKLWLFMFALRFGVCINESMWYNTFAYGKSLNAKAIQLRKDNKQPRNFTGGGTERIAYLTFIMWFPQGSYTNVTDPSGCCISKQNPY